MIWMRMEELRVGAESGERSRVGEAELITTRLIVSQVASNFGFFVCRSVPCLPSC